MTIGPPALPENAGPAPAAGSLTTTLTGLDSEATGRLTVLNQVYQARTARLARAAASATTQFGANSSQAKAATTAVAESKTSVARLSVANQHITTVAPTVPASGWVLHGRVYHSDLEPASAYCVFLVDSRNAYQSAAGFAYTDATGYFLLTYSGGTVDNTLAAEASEPATLRLPLSVEITNLEGLAIYIGPSRFDPVQGTAA